jgi:hypothetical protein
VSPATATDIRVQSSTVNRHYFNLEDDVMQEIIDGWAVADVGVFRGS